MLSDLLAHIQYRLGAEIDAAGKVLTDTSWSERFRASEQLWMLVEGAHVLTLMLFAGTILIVDLRLLGALFRQVPVSKVADTILPATYVGFGLMVVSGLLLFLASPFDYYHNFWFRLKLLFIALAAVNIFLFHRRVQADRASWDDRPRPPGAARAAAGLSLALWASIIVAGRFVAYDWFDCDRAGGFVSAASGCPTRAATIAHLEAEGLM